MQLGQGMDGAGQTLPPWAAVKHSRRAPGRACCVNVMGAQGRWNRTAAHALRQGFCLRQRRLNGAYRAAPSQMGHQWPTARQETDVFLLGHTDFERGFIRAEVIKYDDYVALGSEKACRDQGKIGVEGKEYVVQDGDIMHFLFNV